MVRSFYWMFIIGMTFKETWIPNSGLTFGRHQEKTRITPGAL